MKITKTELKNLIKEALVEELSKKSSKRKVREVVEGEPSRKVQAAFRRANKLIPSTVECLMDDCWHDLERPEGLQSISSFMEYAEDMGETLEGLDSRKIQSLYDDVCLIIDDTLAYGQDDDIEESCKGRRVREAREFAYNDLSNINDYEIQIGSEFNGGHGGDAFNYWFTADRDGMITIEGNDREDKENPRGPYKTLDEGIIDLLKYWYDNWDETEDPYIDDEEFIVYINYDLSKALSSTQKSRIKQYVEKFKNFRNLVDAYVMFEN